MELFIPKWVPATAASRITELWHDSRPDSSARDLLRRLATYDVMKTDVWEKLPSEPAGAEGRIIDAAFFAVTLFPSLVPRPRRGAKPGVWKRWSEALRQHPTDISFEDATRQALALLQSACALKVGTEAMWHQSWRGDPSMTHDKTIDMLHDICLLYDRLAKQVQTHLKTLPPIKRPYHRLAPQVFFAEVMSSRLGAIYGRPLDSIVAALSEVAFDMPDGIAVETIRWRRRDGKGPEEIG